MPATGLALGFAAALAIVHFLGEELEDVTFKHQTEIASFATGVTVTYVFLQLLPEHHKGVEYLGNFGFLFGLLGFSALHLTKKYVTLHEEGWADIRHEFKEIHTVFLFTYHFALGLLLQQLTSISIISGLLFFLPVFLHTAISSLSLTELHEDVLNRLSVKVAVSISPVLGVVVGVTDMVSIQIFHALLGLVTGMFLYTVIHDALPASGEGAPRYYVLGSVLYAVIIVATWVFV